MSEYYTKAEIQKELKEVQKENEDDESALAYCKCKLIYEQTIKDAIQDEDNNEVKFEYNPNLPENERNYVKIARWLPYYINICPTPRIFIYLLLCLV